MNNQGQSVDALAIYGEEGRGKLRKASGRCKQSLIRGSPNGATQCVNGALLLIEYIDQRERHLPK